MADPLFLRKPEGLFHSGRWHPCPPCLLTSGAPRQKPCLACTRTVQDLHADLRYSTRAWPFEQADKREVAWILSKAG
jgi:hypothetical protein